MKMSKRAETALRKSIKHWEVNILRDGGYPKTFSCALCRLYNISGDTCKPCPIFIKTKHKGCMGTAYDDYCDIYNKNDNTPEMKKQARRMIRFMKSLLPKKGRIEDGK